MAQGLTRQLQESDILFKRSIDGGATFGDTINLSNNEGLSLLPKMSTTIVSGNNNVYIVWVDRSGDRSSIVSNTTGRQTSNQTFYSKEVLMEEQRLVIL